MSRPGSKALPHACEETYCTKPLRTSGDAPYYVNTRSIILYVVEEKAEESPNEVRREEDNIQSSRFLVKTCVYLAVFHRPHSRHQEVAFLDGRVMELLRVAPKGQAI